MNFKNISLKKILIGTALLSGVTAFAYNQNNHIVVNKIDYENENVPKSFNNFRIAHISDLHSKKFGSNQSKIIKKIAKLTPDIMVITGDLIDSSDNNFKNVMSFVNRAVKICPVYYVAGNNEYSSGKYKYLRELLIYAGVQVLDDESAEIIRNDQTIKITGIKDPTFTGGFQKTKQEAVTIQNIISQICKKEYLENRCDTDNGSTEQPEHDATIQQTPLKILLSHRPEHFHVYQKNNYDLVFSGHTHGGQVRIPFFGAILAPGQGYFPKLAEGMQKSGNTSIIISRGLGNSSVPLRIFNYPEIVLCVLKHTPDIY